MPGEDWTIRSIDEIKETEVSSIAIGPFGSRMKADLYTSTGVPVIRGTARTLTMRCSRLLISAQTSKLQSPAVLCNQGERASCVSIAPSLCVARSSTAPGSGSRGSSTPHI